MDQDQLNAIRASLEAERASVERHLAEYGGTAGTEGVELPVEEGFADSAHATTERSEVLSLIGQLQSTHSEIVDAIRRIDAGTYGKCESCGEEIPVERLEAIPTARLCVTCKQSARSG